MFASRSGGRTLGFLVVLSALLASAGMAQANHSAVSSHYCSISLSAPSTAIAGSSVSISVSFCWNQHNLLNTLTVRSDAYFCCYTSSLGFATVTFPGTTGCFQDCFTLTYNINVGAAGTKELYVMLNSNADGIGGQASTNCLSSTCDAYIHRTLTVNPDTPPTTTLTLTGTKGSNGWWVSSVSATLSATDDSGCVAGKFYSLDGAPDAAYTGAVSIATDGSHTFSYYSKDCAGLTEARKTASVPVDKTRPSIAGSRSPAANGFGWNNGDVAVSWTCTDATSGVAVAPPGQVVGAEGAGQSRTGTCTDNAGNSASSTVGGISIDRTAPGLSGSRSPAPNANGWNNADVTVSFACSDALSGVDAVTGLQVVSEEGAGQGRSGACSDKAGNSAVATVGGISIDKTPPGIAPSGRNPAPNAAGWNNQPVTLTWACSDALSGPATGSLGQTLSAEGYGQSASATCSDLAGNTASGTVGGIHIDLTPPSLAASRSPAPNANGWNNVDVTVSFGCADALSGVDTVSAPQVVSAEGAGQSRFGACADKAGNSASSTVGGISIDKTPPVVTVRAPLVSPGAFSLSYTAADALSGLGGSLAVEEQAWLGLPLVGTDFALIQAVPVAGLSVSGSFSWDPALSGVYCYRAAVSDLAGNSAPSYAPSLTVLPDPQDSQGLLRLLGGLAASCTVHA